MSLLMKALKQAERRHQEIAAAANSADTVDATLAAASIRAASANKSAPARPASTSTSTPTSTSTSFESMTLAVQQNLGAHEREAALAATPGPSGARDGAPTPRAGLALEVTPLDAPIAVASPPASSSFTFDAANAAGASGAHVAAPTLQEMGSPPSNARPEASAARAEPASNASSMDPRTARAAEFHDGWTPSAASTTRTALRRHAIWIVAALAAIGVGGWLALGLVDAGRPTQFGSGSPVPSIAADTAGPVSPEPAVPVPMPAQTSAQIASRPVTAEAPSTDRAATVDAAAPARVSASDTASNTAADTAADTAGDTARDTAAAAARDAKPIGRAAHAPTAAGGGSVPTRNPARRASPASQVARPGASTASRPRTTDVRAVRAAADTPAPSTARAKPAETRATPGAAPARQAHPEPVGDASIRLTRSESRRDRVGRSLEAGYAALSAGDDAAATRAYEAALQLDRNNADAWVGLASIAARAADPARATSLYGRALEIEPSHVAARSGLLSLRASTDPIADESRLRSMIADAGASPPLLYALGNALAAQQRWPDAQQAYFGAASGDPVQPDYAFNLAVSLDRLRQPKVALDYYRRALRLAAARTPRFDVGKARERVAELERALAARATDDGVRVQPGPAAVDAAR